jgi:4-hydroxy-2-oxoglutarate aldolase
VRETVKRMAPMMKLAGVFAPIPTPFDRDDAVDLVRLRSAFTRWVASPLTGFVVLGSTGEAVLLDEAESECVVAAARESVPPDRPFIVGTGRESTADAVRAATRAARLGADAVLVRTPGFFKPQMTTDAFLRHYSSVADASPVPVILYNITALTGVTLVPDTVARLAGHPNIIGIKESGGDIGRLSDLVSSVPEAFSVLAGSAATFHAALAAGATGGILALSCVVPDLCVRLYELTRAGRHADARTLQEQLAPLANLVGSAYGVPGVKAALNLSGVDVGYPRPPLMVLADPAVATLQHALRAAQELPV